MFIEIILFLGVAALIFWMCISADARRRCRRKEVGLPVFENPPPPPMPGQSSSKTGDDEKRHEALQLAAEPLIKYLCENWHPHVTAVVTPTSVEVLSGEISIQKIYKFLRD